MLFFESGDVAGTVGGGCIEAEVWAEARAALRSGSSALHHFSLTAEEASEEGMVCGGTMDIFIDVWAKENDGIVHRKLQSQAPASAQPADAQHRHTPDCYFTAAVSIQLALGPPVVCSWLDSSIRRPRR